MSERHPVIPGAEPSSHEGEGDRGRIGIVVIHGFTGNPVSVRPLADALAERGFTIDVPRLPGHGTHWEDMAETRYADWYAEVSRAVDRVKERCGTVVAVGLSMGGTLAFDVACRRQGDVSAVMGINATMREQPPLMRKLTAALARVVPAVPGALAQLKENDIAKGGDEQAYPKVPLEAALSLIEAVAPLRARLPDLRIPAVVAYSRTDHSVPNASSKEIFRLIASADKREVVLERSYHVATLDYDLDLLVEEATALADQVGAKAGTGA